MHTIGNRRSPPLVARALTAVLTAALLLLGLAGSAQAAEAQGVADENRVVLSGRVDVAADETVRDVVVMHGSVAVDGIVEGSVIVLDGPVAIRGEVTRDVIALNGAVVVADGARIGHDLVTPRSPQVADSATIDGAVRRVRTDWGLRGLGVSWFWSWLAVSVSTLALGLLLVLIAPRAADAALRTVRTRPGQAAVGALIVAVGLPALAVVAILTVVGIPFGVGLLLAFAMLYSVGYVAIAWMAGRLIRPRTASQLEAFVIGWVIVRAIAVVPFLEGLLWFPGAAFGLGALFAAAWSARQTPAAPTIPAAGAPA